MLRATMSRNTGSKEGHITFDALPWNRCRIVLSVHHCTIQLPYIIPSSGKPSLPNSILRA